jgi:hypothetical protein
MNYQTGINVGHEDLRTQSVGTRQLHLARRSSSFSSPTCQQRPGSVHLDRLSWLPNVENAAHRVAEAAHGNAARARKMIEQILTHLDPEGGR